MNVDYQTETEQFGAWEAAWSKHCPEIDRRIVIAANAQFLASRFDEIENAHESSSP